MTGNMMNGGWADNSRFAASRPWSRDILVLIALIGGGVALRVALSDLPNFAPVAALALFAGYFFGSTVLALCVPLAVMALSDWVLGSYDWYMMALVYGMLALPALAGPWLRRTFNLQNRGKVAALMPVGGLVGSSLIASVLFFLVTNFGVWMWFGSYELTFSGLVQCYAAAIPFFRYTLAGDLMFSVVLFGSYAVAMAMTRSEVPVPSEA